MDGDKRCLVCGGPLGTYDIDGVCGRCAGEASSLPLDAEIDPDCEDIE